MAQMLVSEADFTLPDAALVAARLVEHMAEHDVVCETSGACTTAHLGIGSGVLEATESCLKVRVEAADLGALELLREFVVSHVAEFADGATPVFAWRGNVSKGARLANFREVRLKSAVDLTPRMRRLTFTGDVARFACDEEIHVRLYFPPEGVAEPEWPRPGADGGIVWPADEKRPEVRYYTVRRANVEAGEIEIDVLLHEDSGPGSAFAVAARPGSICGMAGPVGRIAPVSGWTLLAGDETALPAIARMLEGMPEEARGLALIEVDGPADELPIRTPEGVALRWLHRATEVSERPLVEAIRTAEIPCDSSEAYVWVACEHGDAKAIRSHLRTDRGLQRDRHQVVGYWERSTEARA
jgi:NADPH-dependent ferric siderophore reductase